MTPSPPASDAAPVSVLHPLPARRGSAFAFDHGTGPRLWGPRFDALAFEPLLVPRPWWCQPESRKAGLSAGQGPRHRLPPSELRAVLPGGAALLVVHPRLGEGVAPVLHPEFSLP